MLVSSERQEGRVSGPVFGRLDRHGLRHIDRELQAEQEGPHRRIVKSDRPREGRHAVVVMDGALWHQPSLDQDNVTMLKLPPYSPELNPAEQVWQYLKQHWLSNRCFESYDAIVDAACDAWNALCNETNLIRSITQREWCDLSVIF